MLDRKVLATLPKWMQKQPQIRAQFLPVIRARDGAYIVGGTERGYRIQMVGERIVHPGCPAFASGHACAHVFAIRRFLDEERHV